MSWTKKAFEHSKKSYPHESCGMLIKKNQELIFCPCKNIAIDHPELSFVIDPKDWAKYEDEGKVVGIIHNHPDGELQFSETDIKSCNHLDVDFYLVDHVTESMISIKPQN